MEKLNLKAFDKDFRVRQPNPGPAGRSGRGGGPGRRARSGSVVWAGASAPTCRSGVSPSRLPPPFRAALIVGQAPRFVGPL